MRECKGVEGEVKGEGKCSDVAKWNEIKLRGMMNRERRSEVREKVNGGGVKWCWTGVEVSVEWRGRKWRKRSSAV